MFRLVVFFWKIAGAADFLYPQRPGGSNVGMPAARLRLLPGLLTSLWVIVYGMSTTRDLARLHHFVGVV